MKQLIYCLLTIMTPAFIPAVAFADRTIVIVRHGEKPMQGLGQLSCKGLNRSLALAPVLLARYGQPVAIYAPNPAVKKADKGVAYAYIRPLATIEPLAIASGLPVDIDWSMTNIEPLVQALLNRPEGTQVIAWEHHWGETLARKLLARLGENQSLVPKWNDTDFDSIFVITGIKGPDGHEQIAFHRDAEGLNSLSEDCFVLPQPKG